MPRHKRGERRPLKAYIRHLWDETNGNPGLWMGFYGGIPFVILCVVALVVTIAK